MARIGIIQVAVAALAAFAGTDAMAEFKDGTSFGLGTVPKELVAERRMGEPVHFSLEENVTTGFRWDVESNTNECTVVLKHRGSGKGVTCGASGLLDVTVTSRVRTPVRVAFRYRRPWEKDVEPWKTMRLVVKPVESLKLLSLNIWGDYFDNPVAEREAAMEAAILKDSPDIVSLQEVTTNWWASPMFRNLEKAGYGIVRGDEEAALRRAAFTGTRTEKHINHEPLLYRKERLALLDSGTDFFHVALQTSKSVTWAVLEDKIGKRRFAAFATHFWWQGNGEESDTIRELNARHVLFLLSDIRRKWGADLPAILGGDLNSREDSLAHGMLQSGGFLNAARNADVKSPHCSHHGNPVRGADGKYHGRMRPAETDKPEDSIDHIFFTKGIHALRHEIGVYQEVLDITDHSPVLVEFAL